MIRGVVTSEREAVIQIRVSGPAEELELEAIVDTGFNDFLTLPQGLIDDLHLPFAAPMLAALADGNVVETSSYRATVHWDEELREIFVVACDGGALVGMSLLYGHDLHIEAVDGGLVTTKRRN
jgi:clan AA aspartic protease